MSDSVTRVMLATRLDPGVQLNDTYEIDERIASGGMGEVYRGHNIQTGEPVAIKTILPELADQEAIFALFKKEATVLGRLHHDTIVRYYSFSRDPRLGRPYLAMEFVDGISLADRLAAAPLTPSEVRKLFTGVADGLAIAHGAGVIHRDLSPDNIILRDGDVGRPKIIDFGIARSANIGEGTVIGGGFAGKFNFVSPEQLGIHSREVDDRSDIYSLGLVIAAALRGSPLDMGGSHVEVIEKRSKLPDLSDIDPSLRPLLEAMLQSNPDDRPAGASAVSEWLRASASEEQRSASANGGFGTPTSAPGAAGFGAQPTIQPGWTGARTGTPFAGSDATQLVTPTAAPFSTSSPPAAAGESPFGSAAAYPTASQTGLPGTPLPGGASGFDPARKKSGAGRYAVIGGLLLLVLGGGGGAYMAGLFGPASDGLGLPSTDATDAAEKPVAKTEAPPPTAPAPTAASPEHEAIGDALEDLAKAEESSKVPTTEPTVTTTAEPATTVTEPAPQPSEPKEPTTVARTEEPADLPPPGTSEEPPAVTEGPVAPSEPAAGTEEETKEAAAGMTKMVDLGVSWLRQYDGGKCFFAAVTSVSGDSIYIKGFGPDVASFEKLYKSFIQTSGIEPELNGHLINEGQCAAADFLKKVQPQAQNNPEIILDTDSLKLGDLLTVTVNNPGSNKLDLLLIDGDGLVYNMRNFAAETKAGAKSTFAMLFGGKVVDGESPEIVVAITSSSGLAVPQGKEHARAAALFPKLARQIESTSGTIGVDFGYFRLKQ